MYISDSFKPCWFYEKLLPPGGYMAKVKRKKETGERFRASEPSWRSCSECLSWGYFGLVLELNLRTILWQHFSNKTFSHIQQFYSRRLRTLFCKEIENVYNYMDKLWLKVENIEAKGEVVYFEQFLLMLLCLKKTRLL